MSFFAGIDYSTHAVDLALVNEDTKGCLHYAVQLHGLDAFDRARSVRGALLGANWSRHWGDVVALAIEEPAGKGTKQLFRIQGAILASLPETLLVEKLMPSQWRKLVGLPGNASKDDVRTYVAQKFLAITGGGFVKFLPTQDTCDAYCMGLAVQKLVEREAA